MRVVTIASVIDAIFQAAGIDPAALPLSASQKAWALSKVNTELPKAWESEWWPGVLAVEERTIATGMLIAFETAGATRIGAIDADNGVFLVDPRTNRDAQLVKGCTIYNETLYFSDPSLSVGDKVWMRFRPPCPTYTLTVWSGATAYVAGDLAYVAATGHTYEALQAGTNKAPATETTYWRVVGVPEIFKNWLALRISALRMREEDGQGQQFGLANEELDRMKGTLIDAQFRGSRRARVRVV
jgi:hypothetical protein